MYIRLHTDLRLVRSALYDRTLGVRYIVSNDALQVIRLLQKEPQADVVLSQIMSKYNVSHIQARDALYALLGKLDMYGGVHVSGIPARGLVDRVRVKCLWRVRYNGSCRGFVRSMMYAYGALTLFASAPCLMLVLLYAPVLSWWWGVMPILILTTCVLHEAGHAILAAALRVPHVFLAKPGSAAVLYARPSNTQEYWIALCGPAVACLVCTVTAFSIHSTPGRLLAMTVGFIHICSLLPWTADGKTIWRKI